MHWMRLRAGCTGSSLSEPRLRHFASLSLLLSNSVCACDLAASKILARMTVLLLLSAGTCRRGNTSWSGSYYTRYSSR